MEEGAGGQTQGCWFSSTELWGSPHLLHTQSGICTTSRVKMLQEAMESGAGARVHMTEKRRAGGDRQGGYTRGGVEPGREHPRKDGAEHGGNKDVHACSFQHPTALRTPCLCSSASPLLVHELRQAGADSATTHPGTSPCALSRRGLERPGALGVALGRPQAHGEQRPRGPVEASRDRKEGRAAGRGGRLGRRGFFLNRSGLREFEGQRELWMGGPMADGVVVPGSALSLAGTGVPCVAAIYSPELALSSTQRTALQAGPALSV